MRVRRSAAAVLFVPGAPARINVLWLITNGYLQRLI